MCSGGKIKTWTDNTVSKTAKLYETISVPLSLTFIFWILVNYLTSFVITRDASRQKPKENRLKGIAEVSLISLYLMFCYACVTWRQCNVTSFSSPEPSVSLGHVFGETKKRKALVAPKNSNIYFIGWLKLYAQSKYKLHSTSGPYGRKKWDAASPCWRAFQNI